MATVPPLSNESPAAAKKLAAPKSSGESQKWFKVKNGSPTGGPHRIPRSGGDYYLNRGKVISSANYPIQQLLDLGVELEPVAEPGWHAAKQGPRTDDPEAA